MWSVFEPRKLSLETRQELSKFRRSNRLDSIISNFLYRFTTCSWHHTTWSTRNRRNKYDKVCFHKIYFIFRISVLYTRGICKDQKISPKIVCGPELVNQFIGNSERNIRELFLQPMTDQAQVSNDFS
jgi:hypothetical protein